MKTNAARAAAFRSMSTADVDRQQVDVDRVPSTSQES
jgi:hypothetical protein